MNDSELHQFERDNVRKMSPEGREKALKVLREHLSDSDKAKITEAYRASPDEWWVEYHFFWGMNTRNLLRTNGCSEKELGVKNLDDYYVVLVEQALGLEDSDGPVRV